MLPDLHQKTEIFQIRSAETTSYQNCAVHGAAGEEKSNFSGNIKSEAKHITVFCFAFLQRFVFLVSLKIEMPDKAGAYPKQRSRGTEYRQWG